jgi:hypothetical protein
MEESTRSAQSEREAAQLRVMVGILDADESRIRSLLEWSDVKGWPHYPVPPPRRQTPRPR